MKTSGNNICGLGKVHQLFGAEWPKVIEELNRELAA
jgi:type I restriction enzyme R subunit